MAAPNLAHLWKRDVTVKKTNLGMTFLLTKTLILGNLGTGFSFLTIPRKVLRNERSCFILESSGSNHLFISHGEAMSLAFSPLPLPPLAMASSLLQPLDWSVIAIYFAILIGVCWWVIRKNTDTADDYFLAGRHLEWWIVGASIFASNIGSEHVVGLAGSGATDGVAMAHYELHAWCLLVLAWVLVPFYMRTRVYTMPEFLEKRFSPSSRLTLTLVSLVLYVLSKVAVGIFAGGVVFGFLLPEMHLNLGFIYLDSFWVGCLALLLLTGLYTTLGGMRAVAYTETIQVVVLIAGSLLVTFLGLHKVGGWEGLKHALPADMFNLWKPIVAVGTQSTWAPVKEVDAVGKVIRQAWYFNGHYPWLGMIVCAPVIGLWYWCTCQYIVQRTLGAKNEQHARRGSILASFLKLLPVFIFIIPGMVCFALAKQGDIQGLKSMVDATGAPVRDQLQNAFPSMVAHVLPVGCPRTGGGGPHRGADEFTRRRLQRQQHAVHH
jgi:solute:Na+ symporter, SSS family